MKQLLVLVLVLFATGFALEAKDLSDKEYKEGQVIVKVKDSSVDMLETIYAITRNVSQEAPFISFKDLLVINFDSSLTVEEVIDIYQGHPNVIYVEPNYIYHADVMPENIETVYPEYLSQDFDFLKGEGLPNDPRFNELWGMHNLGQGSAVADADIDAPEAWELNLPTMPVVVAVIDTGIDYKHDELKNLMWKNPGETGTDANGANKETNNIDDDGNGYIDDVYGWDFANKDKDPMDDHSHGTHCAGTIGAETNNNLGVAGVFNNIKFMAIKFLSGSGSGTTEDAILAIEYATMNGAQVMSNSWGGGEFSQALQDAIEHAKDKNVLFVAAAGNSSSNNDSSPHYPSSYPVDNILAVAATTNKDVLADFSCYGKTSVDIAAPGDNILSTVPNNKYKAMSGTSMATPHVSGVAAYLLGHEPSLTPQQIIEKLMKTSDKLISLKNKVVSHGRLNLNNALTGVEPAVPWVVIDPSEWINFDKAIASAHPYVEDYDNTWTINHPGATFMRIHFPTIDTEARYDFVYIMDANDKIYDVLSGKYTDYWTEVVPGNTVKIRFKSDHSVNKYGFDIDKYGMVTK